MTRIAALGRLVRVDTNGVPSDRYFARAGPPGLVVVIHRSVPLNLVCTNASN